MKPNPSLHTQHRAGKTAGEKQQLTLTIATGKSPIGLTPTERMMNREGFSQDQLKKLVREVDQRHVHTREFDGKKLTYIEGWYAMAQANAIFGYASWDREMVHFERVMERIKSDDTIICGYMARVRIRVRAGSTEIVREGTGWGSASASTATAANERALKSAETDATKRALSTFGSRFGLSLYDKDHVVANQRPAFTLFTPDGHPLAENLSPEGYSTGLRQLIELCKDTHQVDQLSRHNRAPLAELRVQAPSLRNAQGAHFVDLLLRLMLRRREKISAGSAPAITPSTPGADSGDLSEGPKVESGSANGTGAPEMNAASERLAVAPMETDNVSAVESDGTRTKVDVADRTPIEPARTILDSGGAFRRYTGQSPRRRTPYPYPFPARSEVRRVEPAASVDNRMASTAAEEAPGQIGLAANPAHLETASALIVAKDAPKTLQASPSLPSKISFGLKIDKSKLLLGLERRIRDKAHLRRVAEFPCLVCNRQPSHAHHVRFAQRRGLSQKVSDEYVVPLCALHHSDLHRHSSERDWWKLQNIDPLPLAKELWFNHH